MDIVYEKLDGEELIRKNDIEGRWKNYFVKLLNGDEIGQV